MNTCHPYLRGCSRPAVDVSTSGECARRRTQLRTGAFHPRQYRYYSPASLPASLGGRFSQPAVYSRRFLRAREMSVSARDNDGASGSEPPKRGSSDASSTSGGASKQEPAEQERAEEEVSDDSETGVKLEPGSESRTSTIQKKSGSSQDHSAGPAAGDPLRSEGPVAGVDELLMNGEVSDSSPNASSEPKEVSDDSEAGMKLEARSERCTAATRSKSGSSQDHSTGPAAADPPRSEDNGVDELLTKGEVSDTGSASSSPESDADVEGQQNKKNDSSIRASSKAPPGSGSAPEDRGNSVLAAASGMAAGLRASNAPSDSAASGSKGSAEQKQRRAKAAPGSSEHPAPSEQRPPPR